MEKDKEKDKDSKKIHDFMKKISKKKRTLKTFSQESRVFIEKMFNHINQAGSHYNKNNISKTDLQQLPTGKYYDLLEPPVKLAIENQLKIFRKMTFVIGNRNFDIYMSFPSKLANDYTIGKWIRYIYMWLHVATIFAMPTCSNHLSVYFYFTDMKKLMPHDGDKIMEADNANTAFTFACNAPNQANNVKSPNEIYVYRLEEWFKVFLHESFHSFGLDFAAMDQTAVQERICNADIYKVPCNDLRFYESYTETWAELIQCMFATYFENATTKNVMEVKNIVHKLEERVYGCEAPFSAFQCAKLLDHFGLAYSDLFTGAASQYKETTPVFAYYVIKSVFMNHADEFIHWTMENNRGSLQFKKTPANIGLLADLLKRLCKREEYMVLMDEMDVVLDGPMDYMLAETMRMSCVSFL